MPRQPPDPDSLTPGDARSLALRWLGSRELTVAQLRTRLTRRHFPSDVIATVVDRLVAEGLLDDQRAAASRARHGLVIRRHGRHRVLRQVQALGVDRETASKAVAAAFDDVDEEAQVADALARRLRGAPVPTDRKALARLFAWLLRQGFDADKIRNALRRSGDLP